MIIIVQRLKTHKVPDMQSVYRLESGNNHNELIDLLNSSTKREWENS